MRLIDSSHTYKWKSIGRPIHIGNNYTRLPSIGGLLLFQLQTPKHSIYHAADKDSIHRYMSYFKHSRLGGVSGVVQVAVQRDPKIKRKELPLRVLLEHVIPRYKILISDSKQTESGKWFWENKVIPAALSLGMFVYAYDASKSKFKPIKKHKDYCITLWDTTKGNNNRIVVSVDKIRKLT